MYYLITLKDKQKLKTPVEKTTEKAIRDFFGDRLESIERGIVVESDNKIDFKRYFKVSLGYDDEMKMSIEEDEIEKVMGAFLTGKKIQTKQGGVDGSRIILIKEDYNKTMGWNETHELTSDDWNQISKSGVENLYRGFLGELKNSVRDRLSSGQLKLN